MLGILSDKCRPTGICCKYVVHVFLQYGKLIFLHNTGLSFLVLNELEVFWTKITSKFLNSEIICAITNFTCIENPDGKLVVYYAIRLKQITAINTKILYI